MPNLSRMVWSWAGSPVVGPGATVVHCQAGDEATLATAMNTFFAAVTNLMPTGIQISPPVSGDVIDEASGDVVSHWTIGPSGPLNFSGAGTWVNGVGARLKFPTIGIANGRSVVGAIFLVPLVSSAYEGAGNLVGSFVSTATTAANNLATTPNGLRIYSRKTTSHAGTSFPALSGVCPDRVSWLRSRRT